MPHAQLDLGTDECNTEIPFGEVCDGVMHTIRATMLRLRLFPQIMRCYTDRLLQSLPEDASLLGASASG